MRSSHISLDRCRPARATGVRVAASAPERSPRGAVGAQSRRGRSDRAGVGALSRRCYRRRRRSCPPPSAARSLDSSMRSQPPPSRPQTRCTQTISVAGTSAAVAPTPARRDGGSDADPAGSQTAALGRSPRGSTARGLVWSPSGSGPPRPSSGSKTLTGVTAPSPTDARLQTTSSRNHRRDIDDQADRRY